MEGRVTVRSFESLSDMLAHLTGDADRGDVVFEYRIDSDDRDVNDYEICDICGARMTWTAAVPYGDALICDDCLTSRKAAPIAD